MNPIAGTDKTERNMSKKYELLKEDCIEHDGRTLYRIRALRDFEYVGTGQFGGYMERGENLSHEGVAWVFEDARACGDALVVGNARVTGNAWVYGSTQVCGKERVSGKAWVYVKAWVYDNARVYDNAWV